jgi:hypothetical protein
MTRKIRKVHRTIAIELNAVCSTSLGQRQEKIYLSGWTHPSNSAILPEIDNIEIACFVKSRSLDITSEKIFLRKVVSLKKVGGFLCAKKRCGNK